MEIKLYDLIGIKSGMNFYSEAFYKLLNENDIETEIISNFSHNSKKAALPNIFDRSKLRNIWNLMVCYFKLFYLTIKLKKESYIVVFVYGNIFDIPLMLIAKLNKKVIIDIHEIIALRNKSTLLKKVFAFLYKTCHNKVIAHSEKISRALTEISYREKAFFVPLFRYSVDLNYDIKKVSDEVSGVFQDNSKRFLFFGNIIATKGVEDLLRAATATHSNTKIVIAGQDISNIVYNYKTKNPISSNVQLILRHINDDELKFLFINCDFILLPYKDISQSASIEMAITFRKPILTSKIKYFKNIIDAYPSFGKYIDTEDPEIFSEYLIYYSQTHPGQSFYNTHDVKKYFKNDDFESFIRSIKDYNFTINGGASDR
jgi:glycosyltransferase involved in cell wall biosynthesis